MIMIDNEWVRFVCVCVCVSDRTCDEVGLKVKERQDGDKAVEKAEVWCE